MKTHETATPVRAFDRAYINGQFVTPHGTQVVDLVNPTDNKVIGKVTMADEIDARKAIGAAKEAFNSFSQSSKEYRMKLLQRLHDAVAKRMDQLVEATVLEYGAPQERAKGSNNLAANIFLHFKKVLEDFDLVKTVGTSKVVMEPAGVVGIFTPWNSSAGYRSVDLRRRRRHSTGRPERESDRLQAAVCTVRMRPDPGGLLANLVSGPFQVEMRLQIDPVTIGCA